MSTDGRKNPLLKSLELQGYKTFASKTEFLFGPSITVIVGPNGTGKSNIADAIRWVLGEQSFSLLRGKRTEDMIFSGSESRSRSGMAGATIIFNNDDGWLPIDFSEVSIGRRAYRDGQNEYLLNGQKVRLRDIQELLAESGLAQRTYTVIGQGMVDAALALRASERRELFEEAAGIGLYRIRRQEAQRRLEKTERNLDRVEDILAELKPTLRRLKRQAERAASHDVVRDELRGALRVWYGFHWHKLKADVEDIRRQTRKQAELAEELRRDQEGTDLRLTRVRRRIGELRSELHSLSQRISTLRAERESYTRQLAVAEERLRGLEEQQKLLEDERAGVVERREEVEKRLDSAREEFAEREEALRLAEEGMGSETPGDRSRDDRVKDLRAEAKALRVEVEQKVAASAALETKIEHNQAAQDRITTEVQVLRGRLSELEGSLSAAEDLHGKRESEYEQARERRGVAEAALEAAIESVDTLEASREAARARWSDLRESREKIAASLGAMREHPEALERTTERMVEAARSGELSGLVGELRKAVHASDQLRPAIDAALGQFGNGLAFRSGHDLSSALDWLEARAKGNKAALAPIRPARQPDLLSPPEDGGCLGNAAQVVDVDSEYRELIRLLLSRTLIVEDRGAAHRLLGSLPLDARVVTLSGEVFHSTGLVVVGANGTEGRGKPSLRELEGRLDQVQLEFAAAGAEVQDLEAAVKRAKEDLRRSREAAEQALKAEGETRVRLQQAGQAMGEARKEWEATAEEIAAKEAHLADLGAEGEQLEREGAESQEERRRLKARLEAIESQLALADPEGGRSEMGRQLEVRRRAEADSRRRVQELEDRLQRVQGELRAWDGRVRANRAEQVGIGPQIDAARERISELDEKLEEMEAKSQPLEDSVRAAEAERAELEGSESEGRRELAEAERRYSSLQIELARREEELNGLKGRIEDDFGLVLFSEQDDDLGQQQLILEGLFERLPVVERLPEGFDQEVNKLRGQLRRMGSINRESQREYEELRERVDFLTHQLADLKKAEAQLREVIEELDLLMEREFRATFEQVARNFERYFKRLFDGGSARLVLDGESEINEMGIEIEARLPGRREQTLAMLSGGERSLTAISLIFALLRVSKTPFCVLDEVDAMLDEANIVRFREVLLELSEDTQFILITHARQTVQAAEVVYGITMGSDSTSRVISMKLDEVERELALR